MHTGIPKSPSFFPNPPPQISSNLQLIPLDHHNEIIPFSNKYENILETAFVDLDFKKIVLFYPKSHEFFAYNNQSDIFCPLCKQPLFRQKHTHTPNFSDLRPRNFIKRDYFYLLSQSPRFRNATKSLPSSSLSGSAFITGYYKHFFHEERCLGRGGYGSVFLCCHILDNITLGVYAIKKVPVGDNRNWLMKVLREVRSLERLSNPHIVDYKHSWLEIYKTADFGPEIPTLFILMQYANSHNLKHFLKKPHHYSELWSIFIEALLGGIVHRDLKPENLLLHRDTPNSRPRVLISDFGESETLSKIPTISRTGNTGTLNYCAPEVRFSQENSGYDEKCDVYSLGIILFEMLFDHLPFSDNNSDEIKQKMININNLIPKKDQNIFYLLSKMLKYNPKDRSTISDILFDPILHGFDSEELLPPLVTIQEIPFDNIDSTTFSTPKSQSFINLLGFQFFHITLFCFHIISFFHYFQLPLLLNIFHVLFFSIPLWVCTRFMLLRSHFNWYWLSISSFFPLFGSLILLTSLSNPNFIIVQFIIGLFHYLFFYLQHIAVFSMMPIPSIVHPHSN